MREMKNSLDIPSELQKLKYSVDVHTKISRICLL